MEPGRISVAGGTTAIAVRPPVWLMVPFVLSLTLGLVIANWVFGNAAAAATVYAPAMSEFSPLERRRAAMPPKKDRRVAYETAVFPAFASRRDPETALAMRFPIPEVDGIPFDERYPSLRDWIHPVTASKELTPLSPGRMFGAERNGILRWECGAGHCGVDLDGPRGQPLVAVAEGKVIRVEYSELGRDGRSGRYVRMEHPDGTLTAYMHMDDIAEDVRVGTWVQAGQYIGTLGATAVFQSAPHCHFTLEVLNHNRPTGRDTTDTHYIDPAPFLARARVVDFPTDVE
jgi:murein DD-endopeptidase MepM/ murein hydrolase activator NlpD